jgi:hypothetical protein
MAAATVGVVEAVVEAAASAAGSVVGVVEVIMPASATEEEKKPEPGA